MPKKSFVKSSTAVALLTAAVALSTAVVELFTVVALFTAVVELFTVVAFLTKNIAPEVDTRNIVVG